MNSDSNSVEVSIVIPTRNGGEQFKECLRRVFKQDVSFRFEVIVIDSNSTDNTLGLLNGSPVRLKQISSNDFNHGRTRNMGVELARGKYVVLMTQDAIPTDSSWLKNMIDNFNDNLVAGVFCRQIPREDADVLTKRQLNQWLTGKQNRVVNFVEDWQEYNTLEPMQKLMICTFDDVCSCIRKSVWEKIPFAETYFAEDIEWGKKVIESGYKIVYEPDAAVVHSHNRSPMYEYKRNYLCHRRLFELFALQTVPSLKQAVEFSIANIIKDTPYTLREEKSFWKKISTLTRIPLLSIASVFGQYMGARDERLGHPPKSFKGV